MKERLWQVGFMAALFAAFWFGAGIAQRSGPVKVIQAQKFELVDASGKTFALLIVGENRTGVLLLYDANGKVVATLPEPTAATKGPIQEKPKETGLGIEVYGCRIIRTPVGHTMSGREFNRRAMTADMAGLTSGKNAAGFVRNTSGKTYQMVALSLNYYDARAVQIGSGTAMLRNLASGTVSEFNIPIVLPSDIKGMKVTSFRVIKVDAR